MIKKILYILKLEFKKKQLHGWKVKNCKKIKLKLILNLDSYIDFFIYLQDFYDLETLNKLDSIILDYRLSNDRPIWFIDMGSNIGLMSLYMKKKYKDLIVDSFEPVSVNYYQNKMNQIINAIEYPLHKLILGNENKKNVKIFLNDKATEFDKFNMGMSSIYKNEYRTGVNFEICDMVTFDNFISSHYNKDDLHKFNIVIKIDVEGAELEVVKGMSNFLNKIKNAIMIVELLFESDFEHNKKTVEILRNYGYNLYNYDDQQIPASNLHLLKSGNYIFK